MSKRLEKKEIPAAHSREEKTGRSMMPREWQPFQDLRDEMNRLFEEFSGNLWGLPVRRRSTAPTTSTDWGFGAGWVPAMDITETDQAYEISAELPGMDEKNVEVKLSNGTLRIRGEKKEEKEKEEKEKGLYVSERRFGSFERSFLVPDDVDGDKISAVLRNGVLAITLPKKPEAARSAKSIPISK